MSLTPYRILKTVGRCPTPRTRREAAGPGVKTPGPPAPSVAHLLDVKGSLRRSTPRP